MIVDDRGKTALDAAIVNEKDAIVDLLNAHMKL
jgi:ankyrin repeat protein